MEPINTELYNITRKEDGSLVRVDGLGGETPEMDVAYYEAQIDFYNQVLSNLDAQKSKVETFVEENPLPEVEEPEDEEESEE